MSGWIASQLVGHKPTWATTLPSKKPTEEPYRGVGITPLLDEYADDVAVLVCGAIEIVLLPANAVVEPNRVLDDVRRETAALIQGFVRFYPRSMPNPQLM